jgi:methyl-accepting chemotaxis protein
MRDRPLCELFGIDETNLARRREQTGLGEEERALVSGLHGWAERVAPDLVRDLYDRQLAREPARTILERLAHRRGAQWADLRATLEDVQRAYFLEIFEGAHTGWGLDYYERRLKVGHSHDEIDLPLKWYLSFYAEYEQLVRKYMRLHFDDADFVSRAEAALFRVFNYDMQAIADAYLLSVFTSMGLHVTGIEPEPGTDRAEQIAAAKQVFRQAMSRVLRIAPVLSETSAELRQLSGDMAESATGTLAQVNTASSVARNINAQAGSLLEAAERSGATMTEISSEAAEASTSSTRAVLAADRAQKTLESLSVARHEIDELLTGFAGLTRRAGALAASAGVEAGGEERPGHDDPRVADILSQVQEIARHAASASEKMGTHIEAIQRGESDVADQVSEIAAATRAAGEHQAEIARVVERQSATSDQTVVSTRELANASESVTHVMASVGRTALSTQEFSSTLQDASASLSAMARDLDEAVASLCAARDKTGTT